MNVLDLYRFAEQQNIEVIETSLPENGSLSLMDDAGKCYIGIDESVMDGDALERVHMGMSWGIASPAASTTATPPTICGSAMRTAPTNGQSCSWWQKMRWMKRWQKAAAKSGIWRSVSASRSNS